MSFLDKCKDVMANTTTDSSDISEEDLQNHFLLLFDLRFIFTKVKEYSDTGSFGGVCLKSLLETRLRDRGRFENILKINGNREKVNSLIDIISSEEKGIDSFLKLLNDLYLTSLEKISFIFNRGSMSLKHLIYFFSINMFLYRYGVYKDGVHSSEMLKNIYNLIDEVKKFNYVNVLLLEYYLYRDLAHCIPTLMKLEGISTLFYKDKDCALESLQQFYRHDQAYIEGISCLNALKQVYPNGLVSLAEKDEIEGDYAIWMSGLLPDKFSLNNFENKMMEAFEISHKGCIPKDQLARIDNMVAQKRMQITSMLSDQVSRTLDI
jgi:hypothetical protein